MNKEKSGVKEMIHRKMEENEEKNKIELRIVNEQDGSNLRFEEPEWMRILRNILLETKVI